VTRSTVERRSHARFPHTFSVEGPPDGSGTLARMVASDLSLGGLYCSSSHDFPEMTRLAVRLQLPNGAIPETVEVEAVVVRRRKLASSSSNGRFELALFFTAMSDDTRERLALYLARHAAN
jgi:PilZ domain